MTNKELANYISRKGIRPYTGNSPYIFISYSHLDWREVMPVIEKLLRDGYRVWFDEGIDPGTEWDENIALHVKCSDVFIPFISSNYLESTNCMNELNYASDLNKSRLLVYLEGVTLSEGAQMRNSRYQAIHKYTYMNEKEFYEKLYGASILKKCLSRNEYSDFDDEGGESSASLNKAADSDVLPGNINNSMGSGNAFPVRTIVIAAAVVIVAVIFFSVLLGQGSSDSGDDIGSQTEESLAIIEETSEDETVDIDTVEEELAVEATEDASDDENTEEENMGETGSTIPDEAIEYDGHYYLRIENGDISWSEAEELCEEAGGHLMTINSSAEQEFLEINFCTSDSCWWIGGFYDTEGNWSWVTGEPMSYSNWTLPSRSTSTSYRYLGIRKYEWQYFNEDGEYFFNGGNNYDVIDGYICEWDAVTENTDESVDDVGSQAIPDDAIEHDGHFYRKYLTDTGSSWDSAEELCELLGGHLATVTTEEEQDFLEINLFLSGEDYWLGGYYDTSGIWSWVTGEEMSFTAWLTEPSQETSTEYRYMGIRDFDWQYYNEEGIYLFSGGNNSRNITGYICEWDTTDDADTETEE